MNIDIVNKIVSNKLGISTEKVSLVNKYYWDCIKNHFYDFNPNPVNVDHVCVFYPNKYHLKAQILDTIRLIRRLDEGKKYSYQSHNKKIYRESLEKVLRGLLNIRKQNKFTN